jgi:hypothetical protein
MGTHANTIDVSVFSHYSLFILNCSLFNPFSWLKKAIAEYPPLYAISAVYPIRDDA